MKPAKGYSLVITFTVAIETRDISISPADSSIFSPKNSSSTYMLPSPKPTSDHGIASPVGSLLLGELFSPQAAGWSPRTWAAVILDWKLMIKDRDENALPVASALKCAPECVPGSWASWGHGSVADALFMASALLCKALPHTELRRPLLSTPQKNSSLPGQESYPRTRPGAPLAFHLVHTVAKAGNRPTQRHQQRVIGVVGWGTCKRTWDPPSSSATGEMGRCPYQPTRRASPFPLTCNITTFPHHLRQSQHSPHI
jgi:hypothetical protein